MVLTLGQSFISKIVDVCASYIENCNENGIDYSKNDMLTYVLDINKRGVYKSGKARKNRKKGPKTYSSYTIYNTIQQENIKSQLINKEDFRKCTDKDGKTSFIEFDIKPNTTQISKKTGELWRSINESEKSLYETLCGMVNESLKDVYESEQNITDENTEYISNFMKDKLNVPDEQINSFFEKLNRKPKKPKSKTPDEKSVEEEPKRKLPVKKSHKKKN
jgi:hypothetical protein